MLCSVKWSERSVYVGLTRESVKDSPRYYRDAPPLSAEDEARLHRHYGATADAR